MPDFGLFLAALIFAGADLRAAAPARGAAVIRNRQQAGWIGFAQTAHAFRPFPPLRQPVPFRIKNDLPHRQDWRFSPTGTLGWQQAQSTAGGLLSSQFESATLESKGLPGLYACGELLDIDGDCGGYNLQWAWSSGFVAGKSAAVSLLSHSQPPAEANS